MLDIILHKFVEALFGKTGGFAAAIGVCVGGAMFRPDCRTLRYFELTICTNVFGRPLLGWEIAAPWWVYALGCGIVFGCIAVAVHTVVRLATGRLLES